jgi:hypothetical protein
MGCESLMAALQRLGAAAEALTGLGAELRLRQDGHGADPRLRPLLQQLDSLSIIKPHTMLRWHRAGFRAYWHWKSRTCGHSR